MKQLAVLLMVGCGCAFAQVTQADLKIASEAIRLMQAKQHDAAIRLLRGELEKNPRNVTLWSRLYFTYRDLKQYNEAIAAMREAVRLDPKNVVSLSLLGQTYFESDDRTNARTFMRQAVEAAGPDPALLINMSVAPVSRGQPEFTEMVSEELRRLHPEHPVIANNLANALAEQKKDLDRALQLAQFAFSKLPNAAPVIDTLGWVYFVQGHIDEAFPLLCRALSMQASSQPYQLHVRRALEAMSSLNRRQRDLRDWLRTDDDPEREARIRELASELAN